MNKALIKCKGLFDSTLRSEQIKIVQWVPNLET